MSSRGSAFDSLAIVVCTLVWGTTWYAITLQLGVVDPVVSVAYRFALASLLLFLWCAVRGERIALTRRQHVAALYVGILAFAINYPLAYWAVERVASAVVAVIFAAMAFLNLLVFRFAFGQRASRAAWTASGLGIAGVALLSWSEIAGTKMNARALTGVVLALAAVSCWAISNVYARRGEQSGAPLATSMAWAMGWGAILIGVFVFATDRTWAFEVSVRYVVSLCYLAIIGSFVAFLLYYGLARRRGYTTASYIPALTPLIAMAMSTVFEGKRWNAMGLLGVGLVLTGQWLLLRIPRARSIPSSLHRSAVLPRRRAER